MFNKQPPSSLFHRLSPAQILLSYYLIAIIISAAILSLPFVYKQGVDIAFIDILFTAVSALSVTGLTTISIGDSFSTIGLFVLAIILHLGAVGLMTVSTLIWLAIGKKIGLSERRLIMTDQNQTTFGGMVQMVKEIIYVVLIIECIGVVLLGTHFLKYFPTVSEAYLHGFFGTISAISNAGFSIENNSLINYSHDYFVQSIIMFLIIFGAIGFPVLIEIKAFLLWNRKKKRNRRFRFSLFAKLTTTTFFILIIVGTILIYLLDMNHFFIDKGWLESFFYALFQSVTTRSSGLSTMDIGMFTESNHLLLSLLMFIGASPSSAGGGIRTTTFALVVIFIITYARGGKKIRVFNREIYDEDLLKAVTVMILAIGFVFVSLLIISIIEPFTMTQLFLEVTSAFGTVGLSLGVTNELTWFSKVILMILMFIGRIGVVTFLLSFRKEKQNEGVRYPKERMIIG